MNGPPASVVHGLSWLLGLLCVCFGATVASRQYPELYTRTLMRQAVLTDVHSLLPQVLAGKGVAAGHFVARFGAAVLSTILAVALTPCATTVWGFPRGRGRFGVFGAGRKNISRTF